MKVTYYDCNVTVDAVMRQINEIKTQNSRVVLADGSTLGAGVQGLSFKDVSGVLGASLTAAHMMRIAYIKADPSNMMRPFPDSPEEVTASNGRSYFTVSSMVDTVSEMLGFTGVPPPPILPDPASSSSGSGSAANPSVASMPKPSSYLQVIAKSTKLKTEKKLVLQDLTSSHNVVDRKPPAVDKKSSSLTRSAAAVSSSSVLEEDSDSSDDDSIPGPAVFK